MLGTHEHEKEDICIISDDRCKYSDFMGEFDSDGSEWSNAAECSCYDCRSDYDSKCCYCGSSAYEEWKEVGII